MGVDGSPQSLAALDWAARRAAATGAAVEVVATWEWPTGYGRTLLIPAEYDPSGGRSHAWCVRPSTTRGAAIPASSSSRLVVEGRAANVLVDASRGADLLASGAAATASWPERSSAR